MEDVVAQGCENAAVAVEHPVFDESLVAGPPHTGRKGIGVVVFEQIGVGLVQHRFVARWLDHCRLDVVGHHDLRNLSHVLEAAHVRSTPVLDLLGQCCSAPVVTHTHCEAHQSSTFWVSVVPTYVHPKCSGPDRLDVEPSRHPHRGHEHLCLVLLAVESERHGHAGVVNKQTLAR